jgi:hypothetical protein
MISILRFQTIQNYLKKLVNLQSTRIAKECILLCMYIKPSIQQISNQLIPTFVSIEFINNVKITRHVSAHLEPSSGDTLLKAIKCSILIIITMDPYYKLCHKIIYKIM